MRILVRLTFSLLLAAFAFFAVPAVVSAASFNFAPSNGNFVQGCTSEVTVLVDTAGASSNAADIEITYNPAEILVLDADPGTAGVQVETGNAYQAYVFNSVTSGTIRVAAGSFIGTLNGNATFIVIPFQSIGGTVNSGFTINFTGSGDTLDSNIAETSSSNDLLTSVTNGSYTFSNGSCIADTTAPGISFNSPVNGATGVNANANIVVTVSDAGSGVDIDTVVVTLNGVPYMNGDTGFSFAGGPSSYVITIDPAAGIPQGVASTVVVQATDLAGNTGNRIMTFNIPSSGGGGGGPTPTPGDTTPPVIIPDNPTNGSEVEIDDNLTISLKDSQSGVDLTTLLLILNGQTYRYGDSEVEVEGSMDDYTIILNPLNMLPSDQYSYLTIFVRDNSDNASIETITFGPDLSNLPDTAGPTCACTVTPSGTSAPSQPQSYASGDVIDNYNNLSAQLPQALQALGLPGALSLLLAFAGLLAFFSLLFVPELLGFMLGRGNSQPWGVVYQDGTTEPVAGAGVVLKTMNSDTVLGESVTDFYGRYQFTQPAGDYDLSVRKSGYGDKDLAIHHEINSQIDYVDLIPDTTGPVLMLRVLLQKLLRFMQKQNLAFAAAGLTLALVAQLFNPGPLTLVLCVFHGVWFGVSAIMNFLKA